jgi:REP element-mobilizing transposase RayT
MDNTTDVHLPKRKNLRLPGYDYRQNGAYFITVCTKDRMPLLGEIVGAAALSGPHITLSHYGQIADQYIRNINTKYQHISVPVYCIMPNHIHLIVMINIHNSGSLRAATPTAATPTVSIPSIIHALKTLATKETGISLWQRGYYEHIIRNGQDYLHIWQYIETNPAKWMEDRYYYHNP